jgi:hypothetical protein
MTNNTCFVIQPFDKDKYDKRFTDIFEPAILDAGLEAYRVDKDPSTRIPIDDIHEGIKQSKICFAEITTDNPNVWYELGFAFASGKDVVMVCSEERKEKFPFDIQHKLILTYKTGSTSDFQNLKTSITEKLTAFIQTRKQVQKIIENPVQESEGLQQHEITMLLFLLENQISEEQTVSARRLQNDMEAAGFTKVASNIAFRELKNKGFVEQTKEYSEDGDQYIVFRLTEKGENWILSNKDKIVFKKTNPVDDLPF